MSENKVELKVVKKQLKEALEGMKKIGGSPTFIFPEMLDYKIDTTGFKSFLALGDNEIAKELADVETIMLLVFQPRSLYDYLDSKKIFIGVRPGDNFTWQYSIYNDNLGEADMGYEFKNRWEAEKAAFIKALDISGDLLGKKTED